MYLQLLFARSAADLALFVEKIEYAAQDCQKQDADDDDCDDDSIARWWWRRNTKTNTGLLTATGF